MKKEPSVLLIDDMKVHGDYLDMLKLQDAGWTVVKAIGKKVTEAYQQASEAIDQNEGFTFALVDVMWKHNDRGGIEILETLWKKHGGRLPFRRVLILSRAAIVDSPDIKMIAQYVEQDDKLLFLQLTTDEERAFLRKTLLKMWRQMKRQVRSRQRRVAR
jgi:hypothetical protein